MNPRKKYLRESNFFFQDIVGVKMVVRILRILDCVYQRFGGAEI